MARCRSVVETPASFLRSSIGRSGDQLSNARKRICKGEGSFFSPPLAQLGTISVPERFGMTLGSVPYLLLLLIDLRYGMWKLYGAQSVHACRVTDDPTGQIAGTSFLGISPNGQRMGSYLTIRCKGIMKNRVRFECRSLSRWTSIHSHDTRVSDRFPQVLQYPSSGLLITVLEVINYRARAGPGGCVCVKRYARAYKYMYMGVWVFDPH